MTTAWHWIETDAEMTLVCDDCARWADATLTGDTETVNGLGDPLTCAGCGRTFDPWGHEVTTPMNDLDRVQAGVGAWATTTFPEATNASIITHLTDEVGELSGAQNEPLIDSGGPWIGEEAADCLLLLLHLAHRNGFSLFGAAVAKQAVNRDRTWETDAGAKGYVMHTEDADAPEHDRLGG